MEMIPRSVVWPGQTPRNNDGTYRPLLKPDRPWYTVHYTGGGLWLDPDDTVTEARSVQAFAAGPSKRTPWEYNYIIDGQGLIVEYAGDFQAAHSSGENEAAIGVLLLLGFKGKYPNVEYWEQPTTEMKNAVRQLRAWLVGRKSLAVDHKMLPHQQMPGAATTCPGEPVMEQWADFIAPISFPPIPTPTPGGDDMQVRLLILSDSDAQFLAQTTDDGQALYVTWAGPGSPTVDAVVEAHHQAAIAKHQQVWTQPGDIAGLRNCVRVGPLPHGDSKHEWTGSEFWSQAD